MLGFEEDSPQGDVRILCHQPEELRSRLCLSQLAFAQELPVYEEDLSLQSAYPPHALSLVPNPETIRPATPDEQSRYVGYLSELDDRPRRASDVLVYFGDGASEVLDAANPDLEGLFGYTSSPAGCLTTTPLQPGSLEKVAMHFDSGEEFTHRWGICTEGQRDFLTASMSAEALFGEGERPTAGQLRELLRDDRKLLGSLACLHIPMQEGDIYDAFTWSLAHDASTWRNASGVGTKVIFLRR